MIFSLFFVISTQFMLQSTCVNAIADVLNSTGDPCPLIDRIHWIRLKNNQSCVQIVDDIGMPSCFYQQFSDLLLRNRSPSNMLNRVALKHRFNCKTFIIASNNETFIETLFTGNNTHFFPFTNIYLLLPHSVVLSDPVLHHIFRKGLNAYRLRYKLVIQNNIQFYANIDVENILSNAVLLINENVSNVAEQFYGNDLRHPLFDSKNNNQTVFRISMFNCPPYVILERNRYVARVYVPIRNMKLNIGIELVFQALSMNSLETLLETGH